MESGQRVVRVKGLTDRRWHVITDVIVSAILGGLTALLSLLPTFTMPDAGLYDGFMGRVASVDNVFPIIFLFQCIVALVAVELLLRAWDVTVWVYHQFWGGD